MTKALRAPYKVGRLDSLAAVRSELGRLYRYAWARKMDINEATRFAYILKEIRCAIEAEVTERLEKQLMTIEERLEARIVAHHEGRRRRGGEGANTGRAHRGVPGRFRPPGRMGYLPDRLRDPAP
jgi:hypothetical protein